MLISLAVFAVVFVVEHGEVALIATLGDVVVFEGLKHGTARLVGVGAVGETAVFGEAEDLTEIGGEFFGFHIEGAEAFDARGIDEPPIRRLSRTGHPALTGTTPTQEGNHFTEGGGVLAHLMGIGDFCRAEVDTRHEAIDDGGLPHPAVAAEERDLAFEHRQERIDALTRLGRDGAALIADGLIEMDKHLLIVQFVSVKEVSLVE